MSLKEEATCPVCLDIFTDPQILACSHNICRECAVNICIHGPDELERNFDCPVCRSSTRFDELKTNIALRNMVDILRRKNKEQSRCEIHHKTNRLWCQIDNSLICTLCTHDGHNGHKVTTVELAAKAVLSNLENTLSEVAKDKQVIQGTLNLVHKIQADELTAKSEAITTVHEKFAYILRLASLKKESLLELIANIDFEHDSGPKSTLESDLSKILHFESAIEDVKSSSDSKILQFVPTKPLVEPFPDLSQRSVTVGSFEDIINAINNVGIQEHSIPKLYFGEGTADLVVQGVTLISGGHYKIIHVKRGGTLRIYDSEAIFFASNLFIVEQGGVVEGVNCRKLHIAAPQIKIRMQGKISCSHGAEILLASNYMKVRGTVMVKPGTNQFIGESGSIKLRYQTCQFRKGTFTPDFTCI